MLPTLGDTSLSLLLLFFDPVLKPRVLHSFWSCNHYSAHGAVEKLEAFVWII